MMTDGFGYLNRGRGKMIAILQMRFWNGIFSTENVRILIKLVLMGSINNIRILNQTLAWRWPGNKPLSEQVIVGLLVHTCVTRPQWVMGVISRRALNTRGPSH